MDSDFLPPHAPLIAAPPSRFSHATWHSSITLPSSSSTRPTYVTHLLPFGGNDHDHAHAGGLLALTSDGDCHLLDAESLQPIDSWSLPGSSASKAAIAPSGKVSLTNIAQAPGGGGSVWGVTDRSGKATLFDAREAGGRRRIDAGGKSLQIQTPTTSPLLSLAFSAGGDTPLVALGHELSSFDAPIYLYDLRQPSAPVLTYDQSHSDDITFLSFHPEEQGVLLSGSTDGLMTVFDVKRGEDEDEAVLSAANTGASLARGGWLSGVRAMPAEGDGMQVDEGQEGAPLPNMGAIWGVSDMQTAGVWDAASTDPLLPPLSALPSSTLLPSGAGAPSSVARQWQADYIIDGLAHAPSSSSRLRLATGDQSGAFLLTSLPHLSGRPPLSEEQARRAAWEAQCFFPSLADSARGGHDDIVRAVCFQPGGGQGGRRRVAWSGGEDGRVVAWSFEEREGGDEGVVGGREEEEEQEQGRMTSLPSWAVGGSADSSPSGEGIAARRGGVRRTGGASSSPSPAGSGGRFRPYG